MTETTTHNVHDAYWTRELAIDNANAILLETIDKKSKAPEHGLDRNPLVAAERIENAFLDAYVEACMPDAIRQKYERTFGNLDVYTTTLQADQDRIRENVAIIRHTDERYHTKPTLS